MTRARQTAGAFTAEQTHGVALRPENCLIASSEGLRWNGLHASVFRHAPGQLSIPPIAHTLLVYHLRNPVRVVASFGGVRLDEPSLPRRIALFPADMPHAADIDGHPEIVHFYINRRVVGRLVEEVHGADPARVLILPRLAACDPLLEQLVLAVARTMHERPPGHALYADCLAQAMAAHLVQHHSTLTRPPRMPKPDGLTDWRLRRLADHIEAHLGDGLSLDDMAEQAGLSPLYLAKTFKRAFGEPPHAYVTRRRIERAKVLLRDTGLPLAEVALVCGFGGQSHMGEVFRRGVGTSPGAYRRGE